MQNPDSVSGSDGIRELGDQTYSVAAMHCAEAIGRNKSLEVEAYVFAGDMIRIARKVLVIQAPL
jgi:hypothetical protein